MAWIFLVVAGLFEIGWPVGLKLAQTPGRGMAGSSMAILCMAASGWLLYLAQREIPMGTAYAVWTGIGTVGTVLLGIVLFGEPATVIRLTCIALITAGIAGLKFVA